MSVTHWSRRGRMSRFVALVAVFSMVMSFVAVPAFAQTEGEIPADLFEPDNMYTLAKPIAPGAPPQARTFHQVGDQDWAKLDVVAGQTYLFSAGAETGMGPSSVRGSGLYEEFPPAEVYLQLFESDGATLIKEGYASGRDKMAPRASVTPGASDAIAWTATYTGRVYLRALNPQATRLGQYLIWVDQKAPSITGRVVDEAGEPVPWTYVYAYDVMSGSKTRSAVADSMAPGAVTDENGEYMLFDLGASDYKVNFSPDYGYFAQEWWDDAQSWDDADTISTLVNSTVPNIDATLSIMPAQIGGRVVDENGNPIRWQNVFLYYSWDGGTSWSTYSNTYADENGDYGFRWISTGYLYKVAFNYPWSSQWPYVDEYYNDTTDFNAAQVFSVADGATHESIDATLAARDPLISGRVVNEAGDPVDTCDVFLSGDVDDYVSTDADGVWRYFYDAETTISVQAQFDDWGQDYAVEWYDDAATQEDAAWIDASNAEPATGIDATLAAFPPVVAGTVTAEDGGAGIEGVEVWLYHWDGSSWSPANYTDTDENGDYAFRTWPSADQPTKIAFFDRSGTYASEYYENGGTLQEGEVVFPSPGTTLDVDAALAKKAPRVSGPNRFATSVAIAEQSHPAWEGVDHVIIASGDEASMADPLAASGLVYTYGGAPMLLTSGSTLSPDVAGALEEITGVNSSVLVTVIGGTGAVSQATFDAIETIVGEGAVDRIAGTNRYDTARLVMERMMAEGEVVPAALLANGANSANYWDALALSAVSAGTGAPILLVSKDAVPTETVSALEALEPDDIYIAGGTGAVSAAAEAQLRDLAPEATDITRWAGSDRYATAVAVATAATQNGWLGTYNLGVAATLPDALTGGSAMGASNGALLLCGTNTLPAATKNYLVDHKTQIGACRVFGGTGAVSGQVQDQITQALGL